MSTFLGIDIGNTAVKVAVIRTAYRKVQISGLASVEVAQAGGVVEAISQATRAVMGDRGGVGDSVAVAIEGSRTTVKIVGLPQTAAKTVSDVLPFELEAQLPFDLSEAVFDYRVLPGARETKGEELAVLVGVAKTVDVQARIDLAKMALSVEPERIGLGAFPIANMIPWLPGLSEGIIAICDLGTVSSDVLVLKNGEPVFARTVGLGTKGLPGTAAKLARELRTTVAAHRAQGGEPPTRLFLCGGGAYVSGAEAFLSSALEIPVEALPMPTIEVQGLTQQPGALSHQGALSNQGALQAQLAGTVQAHEWAATYARFAKAIGLALGLGPKQAGFNLRKGPLAFERGFAWVKEKVPILAGLAAVILVSFLFSAWAQLYAKSKEKTVLENALGQVTKEVLGEETTSSERAKELLGQQTAINDEDPLPHADGFDVMVKISDLIPQAMVHDIEELDIQKGHVVMHGIVGSIPDAQQIKTNVSNEKCFSDAKITRTNQVVGDNRQKYVLEFDIKCPEDQKGGGAKKAGAAASASAAASAAGEK